MSLLRGRTSGHGHTDTKSKTNFAYYVGLLGVGLKYKISTNLSSKSVSLAKTTKFLYSIPSKIFKFDLTLRGIPYFI